MPPYTIVCGPWWRKHDSSVLRPTGRTLQPLSYQSFPVLFLLCMHEGGQVRVRVFEGQG